MKNSPERSRTWCAQVAVITGVVFAGCAGVPDVPVQPVEPYSIDLPAQPPAPAAGAEAPELPTGGAVPEVEWLIPAQDAQISAATAAVRARVSDDVAVTAVRLVRQKLDGNESLVGWLQPDSAGVVTANLVLPAGASTFRIDAFDAAGQVGHAVRSWVRAQPVGDEGPPVIAIGSPQPDQVTQLAFAQVWGTALDDAGVQRVTVWAEAEDQTVSELFQVEAQTTDGFAAWFAAIPLHPGRANLLTATAYDASGQFTSATVRIEQGGAPAGDPPEIQAVVPASGGQTEPAFQVAAQVRDTDLAVVLARIDDRPYRALPHHAVSSQPNAVPWFAAQDWAEPGEHVLEVVAFDDSGNSTRSASPFTVAWAGGPVRRAVLALYEPTASPLEMVLDRELLVQALPPDKAEQVVILDLDPTAMLFGALEVMKNACGAGWGTAEFTPDCPPGWAQSERNMWRLLTMTPATSDVSGTSFTNLAEIANVLSTYDNLIDDFSTLLALTLGREMNEPLVTNASVAAAIRDLLIATHPAASPGGFIPVTLRDALEDMGPLAERFGPAGGHPGFLVGPTYSKVLADDFELRLVAESNLHWHEGISLTDGPGAMAFLAEGSQGVISADFLDEAQFQVQGLIDNPTVDLGFAMQEDETFLLAGDSPEPIGQGNSEVWSADPTRMERVVAEAARRDFADYTVGCSGCSGANDGALLWEIKEITGQDNDLAEVVVGKDGYSLNGAPSEHFPPMDPNPAGWMRVWTVGGLGYPAGIDKTGPWTVGYVWDIVLEVAQRRLLDGGVAQGDGDVEFPLQGVPVGLSEEEMIAGVREAMEGSEDVLVDLLLGDWYANSDDLHVFAGRAQSGDIALLTSVAGDPAPTWAGAPSNAVEGFFDTPDGSDLFSHGQSGSSVSVKKFGPQGPAATGPRAQWKIKSELWSGPAYVRVAGAPYALWARRLTPSSLEVVWAAAATAGGAP